jgi:RND family efflux transporter MFP subunit
MKMIPQDQTSAGEIRRSPNRIARFFLHILLPLIALACGIAITFYLLETKPKAKPGKRPSTAMLVEVQKVVSGPQPVFLEAMGEIIPARQVEIRPRVSGEITQVSKDFLPGGFFNANQSMLSIDGTDYELVVRQLESEVARVESDLALEMGNQRIAQRELALLGEAVSNEEKALILRKPQLDKLYATKTFAESKLAQARLNLERTDIAAPFNGIITSRMVDTGAKISESTVLATLVGTDAFWLQLTLPEEQLQWVKIPSNSEDEGSSVKIFSQGSTTNNPRVGQVIRLSAALEEQGRMAQLLVRVDDPLCLKDENRDKPKLLLGSYVRAEIDGITIASGVRLDRSHIHEGNSVWLMDNKGLLDIRQVDVIFRGRNHVIVNGGMKDTERLVTSALSSPVAGIPLRLQQKDEAPGQEQAMAAGKKRGEGKRSDKGAE